MSNINKQDLRYGDNVLWFLNELAAYDASDIDAGEFDVYGEDRNGLECCSTIDVTELAADAAKLIEAAEKRIAELTESHSKLRDTMAGIHNTIRMDGGYTPLAAILNAAKRAYEESATAAGIGVKGE